MLEQVDLGIEYPNQFTIRSKVASDVETELSKIVNGKGDWMFYGHSNLAHTGVDSWCLIDLRAFRAALIRHSTNCLPIVTGDKTNADGTCFKWFDVRSFIVAVVSSGHPNRRERHLFSVFSNFIEFLKELIRIVEMGLDTPEAYYKDGSKCIREGWDAA